MKRAVLLFSAVALFLGIAGSALAVPVTWTDTLNFGEGILIPPTYTYQHDISDDGFASLLMGGNDTISSFSLDVTLSDDNQPDVTRERQIVGCRWIFPIYDWVTVTRPDGTECAKITFGLQSHGYDFSSGSETYSGNFWGTLDLWADGKMNVCVSSDSGDFYLDSSTLNVCGDNGAAPVPEPATLLLLGSGLLGLAGFRKKMKK